MKLGVVESTGAPARDWLASSWSKLNTPTSGILVVEIPPPQSSPTLCIGLLEDVSLAPSTLLPFVSTTRFEVEDESAAGTQIPIVVGMHLLWLDGHLKRHTTIGRAREAYRRPRLNLDYERSKRAAMTIVPAYRGGKSIRRPVPGHPYSGGIRSLWMPFG